MAALAEEMNGLIDNIEKPEMEQKYSGLEKQYDKLIGDAFDKWNEIKG